MSCSESTSTNTDPEVSGNFFRDATSNLPMYAASGPGMATAFADLDKDGDLDIVVANEFRPNSIFINDGTGKFADRSAELLPQKPYDSEDIAIEDFDKDGDLDIIFASEDNMVHEFYLNDGTGRFTDASERITMQSKANAVAAADIDKDGDMDVVFGNDGPEIVLINNGSGQFTDESDRLPSGSDITQDIEFGDVDGDNDLDIVTGNENGNKIYFNDGSGYFTNVTAGNIPPRGGEMTRMAKLADIDKDGDLDLLFANVQFAANLNPQDRVLINDGTGKFTDETATRYPQEWESTMDHELIDLDGDNDLDIVAANLGLRPFMVFTNDGAGRFTEATGSFFSQLVFGDGLDVVSGDVNKDGKLDLYLCNRGQQSRLMLR